MPFASHTASRAQLPAVVLRLPVSSIALRWVDTGKRTKRVVLKYDGKSYGVDMFRNFWYPHEGIWAKHDN